MTVDDTLPTILLLSTGGTITGRASDETATSVYQAGAMPVSDVLATVPALARYAHIRSEVMAQIDSKDMHFSLWDGLALRIAEAQFEKDVHGIVVVHGTDTLEETAFFLQLSIVLQKPLVLVGAMRPATALSADGPLNLLHAVRLAAEQRACEYGVLVLMNQQFFAAAEVSKTSAHTVDAFAAPGRGPVGRVFDEKVIWLRQPYVTTSKCVFPLASPNNNLQAWPWVEIITHGVGIDERAVLALVKAGVNGLVLAGTGSGTLSTSLSTSLARVSQLSEPSALPQVAVVRASRCLLGPVLYNVGADDQALGTIPAGSLNPQKARILLLLGLRYGFNKPALRCLFESF